jgi:hypothetical protein
VNLPDEVRSVIDDLLPLFRKWVEGKYAVALAGSYATESADGHSDIDFFLFADDAVPSPERESLAVAHNGGITNVSGGGNAHSKWGTCTNLDYKGFRIETTIKSTALVDGVLADCISGVLKYEVTVWTIQGYCNHCLLADISQVRPLEDPFDLIAGWKNQIVHYPQKLKEAIINRHSKGAKFWLDNPHYLSAIKRGDVVYTTGIVQ